MSEMGLQFAISSLSLFLYMTDMTPVLELTPMDQGFSRIDKRREYNIGYY